MHRAARWCSTLLRKRSFTDERGNTVATTYYRKSTAASLREEENLNAVFGGSLGAAVTVMSRREIYSRAYIRVRNADIRWIRKDDYHFDRTGNIFAFHARQWLRQMTRICRNFVERDANCNLWLLVSAVIQDSRSATRYNALDTFHLTNLHCPRHFRPAHRPAPEVRFSVREIAGTESARIDREKARNRRNIPMTLAIQT